MSGARTTLIALVAGGVSAGAVSTWHRRRHELLLRHPRGITEAVGLTRKDSLTMAQLRSVPRWPDTRQV
jgi:hypothetical protein